MEHIIDQLLSDVEAVARRHDELCAATGELFNIFSVLGLETAEVRTHSRLIAELLDPKGSHGLAGAFLRLFLDQFGIKDFDIGNATVEVEFYIGPKCETANGPEGGRIDILISAGDRLLIIENKIYASDQKDQLLRYYNYARKRGTMTWLFYLTRDGDEPSSPSDGYPQKMTLTCISYKTDMLKWLEACKKEAVAFPLVRETISQYVNLIRALTNQNRSNKMNNEIVDAIVKDPDRLSAFFALTNASDSVLRKIYEKLKSDVKEIAAKLELEPGFSDIGGDFSFVNKSMKECGVQIAFEFESPNNRNLFFGFKYLDSKIKDKTPPDLRTRFGEAYDGSAVSDWWPCWAYWREWRNWNEKTYMEIYFGKGTLKNAIEERLNQMLKVFESVQRQPGSTPHS
jgi:hypothetical protein